jgi:hypothetical protein
MPPVISSLPSPESRQATEPKYAVSAKLVTIRNARESRLIAIAPQPLNFRAAASFAESENAGTLTEACFSPTNAAGQEALEKFAVEDLQALKRTQQSLLAKFGQKSADMRQHQVASSQRSPADITN